LGVLFAFNLSHYFFFALFKKMKLWDIFVASPIEAVPMQNTFD
jgi:hypothetical protein